MNKSTASKPRRRKRWAIGIILAVAMGAAGYGVYARFLSPEQAAEAPALQTTTVRRGDITISAAGSGSLLPQTEIELGFRAGGTLAELTAQVGDLVDAGKVLARLDDASARIQVAQAELNLEQAQMKLETARRSFTQTVEIDQAYLDAAQASYDALVDGGSYDGARITGPRINLEQATEQVALAQAAYDTAWDPGRDWELQVKTRAAALENERIATARAVEKAKDDLEVARAAYSLAVLNLNDDGTVPAAWAKVLSARQALGDSLSGDALRVAEASVEQAELALASAQLALDNTILRAPIEGRIVAISAGVGEAVGTGAVVTMVDGGLGRVRFYLEESDLDKVVAGNPVTVVFDAMPDRTFPGRIDHVDPALVTVDGTVAIQSWASLDPIEAPVMLPLGLSAEVEIVAGAASRTLLIPVQALRELSPGQYAVFVVEDDGALRLRPVEVGLKDFANAEIISGLEQGEIISTGTVETQ